MTNLEMADALEARADQDDAFEREIVNNGGAVSTRAKERTALDRAAAQKLRQMDEALKPFDEALNDALFQPVEMEEFPPATYSDSTSVFGVIARHRDEEHESEDCLFTVGDLRAARTARTDT